MSFLEILARAGYPDVARIARVRALFREMIGAIAGPHCEVRDVVKNHAVVHASAVWIPRIRALERSLVHELNKRLDAAHDSTIDGFNLVERAETAPMAEPPRPSLEPGQSIGGELATASASALARVHDMSVRAALARFAAQSLADREPPEDPA